MKNALDRLDRQIILFLQEDGRMSSSAIARQLNVPVRTIRHRITRMVERKDILPTVVINRQSFEYRMTVDIYCQVELNKVEKVAEMLKEFHEITYIAYSFGDQDLSVQAVFKDGEKAFDFVQKLSNIPEIQRTKTVLVPSVVRAAYEWIPPEADFVEYPGDLGQAF
ncbi:MAG: Lrp/AsnC family transcriptional regulator [Anaerolineales bacterium]|uniref:Lrp/AsnC family transcriptional regulator n=1 Tax=Candidatus Desulfolinea nitratireducens TaxID=2841698 RepID=A0A8J6TJM1_9CHLR|nr:Lrp/AsnC family transcriptional regulator [Candidatus Desulfolinea nitratireducens]MBL6960086.1 Lrp/AsnC family transcriptional regulator [Anaerolineales bacterium]